MMKQVSFDIYPKDQKVWLGSENVSYNDIVKQVDARLDHDLKYLAAFGLSLL
jgi:hypothetical protein